MPNIWVLSDLHLEALPDPEAFKPRRPDFDVLVVAGDVWGGDVFRGLSLVSRLADGKPVVFVLGNHEHWNGVFDETIVDAQLAASDLGVTLLNGSAAEIAGCRFIGATLWSDYQLAGYVDPAALTGEQIDISHPGTDTQLITVGDVIELHRRDRAQLERLLAEPADGKPVVVVTHHAPHLDCVPMQYRCRWRAGGLASDLSHLTDTGQVKLWIHGHVHSSIDINRPNGTRIVCNPAGEMFSNSDFKEEFVIIV